MEISRVVEILNDGKSCGSGYLLTPHIVLTARHVIKPECVGTLCMIHPLCADDHWARLQTHGSRTTAVPAKLGWISTRHDLALIEITSNALPLSNAATIPFGEIPTDGVVRQVLGSGFPAASGVDQRTIIGTLNWVLTEPRRFDIDVISALPRDWKQWSGFSGAAVFADNLLVGVVRTVDGNWNGGVLEATPITCLLEDDNFRDYCHTAGISLPDRLDAGAVDRTVPLDFDAGMSTEGPLRFSPYNLRIPFLGRGDALIQLEKFLAPRPDRSFAWWMVTGGGGAGKTRLARQLCLHMRERRWRAGFLPQSFNASIAALDAWSPRTPTLIVADYVMKNIEQIRRLTERLARRQGLPPLRLLLLEREAGELFESQFLSSSQSERGVLEASRYVPPDPPAQPSGDKPSKASQVATSLRLTELTEDDLWSLVETCPWRAEPVPVPLSRTEFFHRLGQLDSQRRPLVAMILADALATSSDLAGLDDLQAVLRSQLDRDRKYLWPRRLNVAETSVGKTDADVTIAFATMVGGLGSRELEAIEAAQGKPIEEEFLQACGIAIGKPVGDDLHLDKLEPDLIGEFFVLETLGRTLRTNPANRWMPKAAWQANGRAMFDFVARAKQTFHSHLAMQQVEITVEGVQESWFLAALARFSDANSLAEGFDNAQKWLSPHAQSDLSAALAFAQLIEAAAGAEPVILTSPALIEAFHALQSLHQVHAKEPTLRERVAMALFNAGFTLGMLDRSEEEIAVYDDLVERFGAAGEPALRERVARALVNKGFRLGTLDRSEEAIAVYDDLVERFGAAGEPALREEVAQALVNKGVTLGTLDRSEEAIAVYDDLVERFGAAGEPALREQVAMALVNKGVRLGTLDRSEEAIAVCDDLVERFGAAGEPALREEVALALFNKGVTLGMLDRSEEEIAVYDDLVERFGAAGEPALRERVARALVNKGVRLGTLDRSEEAIAVCDDLVERFGAAGEPALREEVALALFNKGVTLGMLDRSEEEIAVYDDLVERFGAAGEPALREQVAQALVNKGFRLGTLDRSEEEIAVYDDLVERFGAAGEPALREQVARVLVNKGFRLGTRLCSTRVGGGLPAQGLLDSLVGAHAAACGGADDGAHACEQVSTPSRSGTRR